MTTFDNLWEREEQQALLQRLRREYPRWQRARRVRRTALASLAVLLVAGITLFFSFLFSLSSFLFPLSTRTYDSVVCNRSGIADRHWAAEASRILTIETL